MAPRPFEVSPQEKWKVLRKAILGTGDVRIGLTEGQRRALAAQRERQARGTEQQRQKP